MFMFSFVISSAKRTSFISFLRAESFLMILCYDIREISKAIPGSLPFWCIVPGIRWLDHENASASHMNSGVHREICFPIFFIFYFRSCVLISNKKSYRKLITFATLSWDPFSEGTRIRGFYIYVYKPNTHCPVYGDTLWCADPLSVESCHEGLAFPALFWIRRGQTIQSAGREDAHRHYKIELNWKIYFSLSMNFVPLEIIHI